MKINLTRKEIDEILIKHLKTKMRNVDENSSITFFNDREYVTVDGCEIYIKEQEAKGVENERD